MFTDYRHFLPLPDEQLGQIDPVQLNLLVAKSIPSLADLNIGKYQLLADEWADGVRKLLPNAERIFRQDPAAWDNDIHLLRLSVLCQYLDETVGIAYNEDQRYVSRIRYTNPSDLFLNGVMDTRQGTCGNMATLYVAIGWRLHWPVSLAAVGTHFVCRFSYEGVKHNIEATHTGRGGFKTDPDEFLIREKKLPAIAIRCGSDLRALRPRELLGVFIGARGRHIRDCGRHSEAELDYLLARTLYPTSRSLYINSMALSVARGAKLFEPGEVGSPQNLCQMLIDNYSHLGMPKRESEPLLADMAEILDVNL
jgi:Transglutaminase-like superfamily